MLKLSENHQNSKQANKKMFNAQNGGKNPVSCVHKSTVWFCALVSREKFAEMARIWKAGDIYAANSNRVLALIHHVTVTKQIADMRIFRIF